MLMGKLRQREPDTSATLEVSHESCKIWMLPRRQQGFILGAKVTRLRFGHRKVTT